MADQGTTRRVGKYELLELVGQGGMGEVWKARDGELDRIVALKLMHISSPDHLLRFRREAHVVATLNHPHIAQLFEFSGEPPFLAMQFIDGVAIQMFVPEDPGAGVLQGRVRALADAARALHYAHERRILHRDVKPGNLLVDRAGDAYVLDFGLAREVKPTETAMTLPGDVLGTPSYMAPEQARGEVPTVGPWTDVYGLGATLYTILCGRPPHSGPTPMATIQSVIAGDSVRPGGDRDIETICLKAMEHDPRRRYPTAAAMADDLGRYLRNEPIEARRPSMAYRVRKRIQRQPIVWTLAALLLAAVAGGIWFGVDQLLESRRNLAAALESPASEWGERTGVAPLAALGRARANLRIVQDLTIGVTGRQLERRMAAAGEMLPAIREDLERAGRGRGGAARVAELWSAYLRGDTQAVAAGAQEQIVRGGRTEEFHLLRALVASPLERVEHLTASLDRNRGQARVWFHLGNARAEAGDFAGAVRDCTRAIEIDAFDPVAWANRGNARMDTGEVAGALADFEEFLRRAPDDPRAPQVQAWIDELRRGREF